MIPESHLGYYPNSLCIESYDNLNIKSNWFEDEYENMVIVMESCFNSSARGRNWCETKENIEQFMESNIFYMIREKIVPNLEPFENQLTDFLVDG